MTLLLQGRIYVQQPDVPSGSAAPQTSHVMPSLLAFGYGLIPLSIFVHLWMSPYTKVEESFNIQAIHDILLRGIPSRQFDQYLKQHYDHTSFPGSVPRTFVGALLLSGLSRPFMWWIESPEGLQILVRAVLGTLNALSLVAFGKSVESVFGRSAGCWFALFQASQFHINYYASRTIPNMFAFTFTTMGLRSLLLAYGTPNSAPTSAKSFRLSLYLLTFAGVVFRSELVLLLAAVTLHLLLTRRISLTEVVVPAGFAGAIIGLCATISIDSFFWQSFPSWPEWTAFLFNTVQGQASNWGTSPWHYYFTHALPRLLLNPATFLLCVPLAVLNIATRARSLDILCPLLSYVALYSLLPHKEWRFVCYIIPGLTAVGAAGASWIWTRRRRSILYNVLGIGLIASVLLSFVASAGLLAVSCTNYPGGDALRYLHHDVSHPNRWRTYVYSDNLATQTGVTRFQEKYVFDAQSDASQSKWIYDKTEDSVVLRDPKFWLKFDYVLAEHPQKIIGSWKTLYVSYGYHRIRVYKPGDGLSKESPTVPLDVEGWEEMVAKHWTSRTGRIWRRLEGMLRQQVFLGYWVDIRMRPRLTVLAREMSTNKIHV